MTSKTIIPNTEYFQNLKMTYFEFVMIAEVILRVPACIIHAPIQALKLAKNYEIIFNIHQSKFSLVSFIIEAICARLIVEIIKIMIIFSIASLFFHFKLSFITSLLFIQLLYSPFFLSLAFLGSYLFLRTGRGEGAMMKGLSVLGILGGLYFPTTIFPEFLKNSLDLISPYNKMIFNARASYQDQLVLVFFPLGHFVLGIILVIVAIYFLKTLRNQNVRSFDYRI